MIRWVKSQITSPCKTVVIIENLCLFFRFYLIYLSRHTELSISAPFFLPAPCVVALLIVWVTFQMCIIIYIILISMYLYLSLEKTTATHSSTLAWKIPWMEEPGGLQSVGSLRVGHD